MSERIGYDSDQISDIPAGAEVAFIYADQVKSLGELVTLEERWPVVVLIDRGLGDPTGQSSAIDVERGSHTPAQAPGWFDRQHQKGIRFLTVYVNRSNAAAVDQAMGTRPFYRWIATDDGTMLVAEYPEAIVQFAGASASGSPGTGHHADASIIRNPAWHPSAPAANGWVREQLAAAKLLEREAGGLVAALGAHT